MAAMARTEPLWDRVDGNRRKMWFFVAVFTLALASAAELLVVVPLTLVLAAATAARSTGLATVVLIAGVPLSVASAVGWVAYSLNRSEPRLLDRLGAVRVPTGELPATKRVLHEMAIAAGLPFPPTLYVLDSTAVNAFVLGRRPESAVAGVTAGMLKLLTPDEQRAVFANLLARLRDGDTRLATVASALMSPVWAMRDHDMRAPEDEMRDWGGWREQDTGELQTEAERHAVLFPLYFVAVVVTELLYGGQMQQQILTSEAADARGMLLLKDPAHMLSALEHSVPEDNLVPAAGAALAPLFFCWTGTAYVGDEDPEMRRIARLRETLGVEGMCSLPEAVGAPAAPRVPPSAWR